MSDATRQHHRMATGEDISGQTKGDKTTSKYATGGSVKTHGHRPVEANHPKGQRGGHKPMC